MATKSLIIRTEVDRAKIAHNCRANKRHRIKAGDVRLSVRNGRSWVRYCRACADQILERDIKKLRELQAFEPVDHPSPD